MNKQVLDIANKILLSLGVAFLDSEEETALPTDPDNVTGIYDTLFVILQERKAPQSVFDKLTAKAVLDNVEITKPVPKKEFGSNILLGFGVDL